MSWQLIVFILFTLVNLYISRKSLTDPKSHGFYRFIVWEFTTALILLNLGVWFVDPFAPHQLISWLLLFGSIPVLILGVREMRRRGRRSQVRQGENLYEFERTTQLVTSGIFRYIRHPMYASLFYLTWGAFFKHISWPGAGLALLATVFLVLTARRDEAANLAYFGEPYREYMGHTKRFVPWVF